MRALVPIVLLASGCIDLDAFSKNYDGAATATDLSSTDGTPDGTPNGCTSSVSQVGAMEVTPTASPAIASLGRIGSGSLFGIGAVMSDGSVALFRYTTDGTVMPVAGPITCPATGGCIGVRIAKSDNSKETYGYVLAYDGQTAVLQRVFLATGAMDAPRTISCTSGKGAEGDVVAQDLQVGFGLACAGDTLQLYDASGAPHDQGVSMSTELRIARARAGSTAFVAVNPTLGGASLYPTSLPGLMPKSPFLIGERNVVALALDALDDTHAMLAASSSTSGEIGLYPIDTSAAPPTRIKTGIRGFQHTAQKPLGIAAGVDRYMVVYEDGLTNGIGAIITDPTATSTMQLPVSGSGKHPQIAADSAPGVGDDPHGVFVVAYVDTVVTSPRLMISRVSCP